MHKRDPEQLFPHDKLIRPFLAVIPRAVHPNHVTILRMILTPVVLYFLFKQNYNIGVPLFVVTAMTDALDGTLARVRKQITRWGTFYDPIADKMLIGSVIILILLQHVNPLIAFSVIGVEILMMAGGWYQRRRGIVVTANIWGKVKMILEFTGVLLLLISLWLGVDLFVELSEGTLILAIIFAVIALLTYSL
ncbi:CDP-alcohol phosphatidyltransferase family protein [Candidatus Uhrbacteria bacterium]|jgi:CDP-diacylglycerol--glycerol-3-phosphate 3-phosphatidyltransferase|nr:CDP-alcohol phosphatidyltransferase family protein [Candidatus Uhrbacteria bacterium]